MRLDLSDSEPGTKANHRAPSSTMIGSGSAGSPKLKAQAILPRKASKTNVSSTAHSSSAASAASGCTKPSSSILSKSNASHSEQSSGSAKAQTMKDLGSYVNVIKDSLLVTPKDPASKLCREAVAYVMKDKRLSMKKCYHVATLIRKDLSFAETLMDMLDANLDDNGMETGAPLQ